MSSKTEGICALTGQSGKFVKSHIIPKAFTRPAIKGEALYQNTRGRGEKKRWDSWYDQKLVVRAGEDILSDIDDAAITLMRKYMLVWSSWKAFRPHFESFGPTTPDHGFRRFPEFNAEPLIRFALSVAWRASASTLPDMNDATLPKDQEEKLKEYVLGKPIAGSSTFPVSLMQLSTRGLIHNQAPAIDHKAKVDINGNHDGFLEMVRVYMDGLIFHVHTSPVPKEHLEDNPIYLGGSNELFIPSVSYEASHQYENMLHLMLECHEPVVDDANRYWKPFR